MSLELKNDHNVYILGAGFSRDAGLPLIFDFLNRMRDCHPWLEFEGRGDEAKAVEEVLRFRLNSAAAAYRARLDLENIEELFSLASASNDPVSKHIPLAIAATLDFARRNGSNQRLKMSLEEFTPGPNFGWLGNVERDNAYSARYWASGFSSRYFLYVARLLGMCSDGKPKGNNTFITFNYDTVLEDNLAELKVPFSYELGDSWTRDASAKVAADGAAVRVLKLHGSANWANQGERRRWAFTVFGDYADLRNGELLPELVPPTWKKIFQGQLGIVWDKAVECLRTATRLVIIGFSMPPTDMHFKYLIAAGLSPSVSLREIHFVSPGIDLIKERAGSLFQPNIANVISYHAGQFGYVTEDASFMHRIGRPFPDRPRMHVTAI